MERYEFMTLEKLVNKVNKENCSDVYINRAKEALNIIWIPVYNCKNKAEFNKWILETDDNKEFNRLEMDDILVCPYGWSISTKVNKQYINEKCGDCPFYFDNFSCCFGLTVSGTGCRINGTWEEYKKYFISPLCDALREIIEYKKISIKTLKEYLCYDMKDKNKNRIIKQYCGRESI